MYNIYIKFLLFSWYQNVHEWIIELPARWRKVIEQNGSRYIKRAINKAFVSHETFAIHLHTKERNYFLANLIRILDKTRMIRFSFNYGISLKN